MLTAVKHIPRRTCRYNILMTKSREFFEPMGTLWFMLLVSYHFSLHQILEKKATNTNQKLLKTTPCLLSLLKNSPIQSVLRSCTHLFFCYHSFGVSRIFAEKVTTPPFRDPGDSLRTCFCAALSLGSRTPPCQNSCRK